MSHQICPQQQAGLESKDIFPIAWLGQTERDVLFGTSDIVMTIARLNKNNPVVEQSF